MINSCQTRVKLVLCLTHQFGNWFPPDPTELGPDPCCLLKLRFANSRTLCCCFELTLNSTQTPFVVSLSSINSCKFQLNPMSGFLDWLIFGINSDLGVRLDALVSVEWKRLSNPDTPTHTQN